MARLPGRQQHRRQPPLQGQPLGQGHLQAAGDGLLGTAEGCGREGQEMAGQDLGLSI